MKVGTVQTFVWHLPDGTYARYHAEFEDREESRRFRERVLEGRGEARWVVRCSDSMRRRLGSAIACYESQVHTPGRVA